MCAYLVLKTKTMVDDNGFARSLQIRSELV